MPVIFMIMLGITAVLGAMVFTGHFIPFVMWVLILICAYSFLIKVDDKYTKELIDGINSGKYISVSSDKVRQIRDEYFEVGEDGKLTLIDGDDIRYISGDGTIYIKSNTEDTGNTGNTHKAGYKEIYVLDGKHYIESEDGKFREIQIAEFN